MRTDFKVNIIRLMQHPVMCKSLSELSLEEKRSAYDLLVDLSDSSINEEYTLLDTIQMSRLQYTLGDLALALKLDRDIVIYHFSAALRHLHRGGVDLSINKWAELISLHTIK